MLSVLWYTVFSCTKALQQHGKMRHLAPIIIVHRPLCFPNSLEARWGWHGVTRVSSREGFVVSSRSSTSFDIFHGAAVLQSQALQLIADILAKHSKLLSLSVWGFHWWKPDKQVGWRIYFIHRAVKTLWPHPQLEIVKNSRSGFNLANCMCSTVQGDHAHRKAPSGNWTPNLL